MATSNSVLIRYENLRSLAFGSIGAAYVGVGAAFDNPIRILKVNNRTNADLLISFNGIDDMDFIGANSAYVYDFTANKSDPGGLAEQPAGVRFYVKQASGAPTSGSIYVTAIYVRST